MLSSILDLDTQNQYFYDSGFSDTPSPGSSSTSSRMLGSPMSTTSDNPQSNAQILNLYQDEPYGQPFDFQRRNLYSSPVFTQSHDSNAQLVITEEPVDKFRFRYKSEMHGTHGSLMGSTSGKSKKTFPTVELRGFHGKGFIRCSLYQTDTLKTSPHSHKLVVRHNDQDVCDPHDVRISPEEGYRAVFMGMGIIHTAKKNIIEELIVKKIKERKFELGRPLTRKEECGIKMTAEQEAKSMNLNQVRLAFQAYAEHPNGSYSCLCGPIFSRPINNMKSALTGELKIARLSAAVSSAAGGDDLFLFVEKVGKKNIKVRFFEVDENDEEIWESWGIFSEADVHHQYAIALRTPPYKDRDIDKHVDVYIQLVRPSDSDRSDPVPFKYKPRDFVSSRKRPRTSSSNASSSELPETLMNVIQNSQSSEFNKSDVLNELLGPFERQVQADSGELLKYVDSDFLDFGEQLETDGVSQTSVIKRTPNLVSSQKWHQEKNSEKSYLDYFKKIVSIVRMFAKTDVERARHLVLELFQEANNKNDDILHNAISLGDINTMVKLLKLVDTLELYDVLQHQNDRRESCLHIACLYDKSEFIRPLINLGANPNIQDNKGNTALHIAVEDNLKMCASKLIDKLNYTKKSTPMQIDLANDDGLTPLHLAVKKRNFEMVQKLLELGEASVKLCISKNGNNVLHLAVEQNDEKIVRHIIENTKVNINEQNTSGFTPLMLAYSMGKEAEGIVQLLLKCGAEPGSPGESTSMDTMSVKTGQTDDSSTDDEYEEKPLTIDETEAMDGEDGGNTIKIPLQCQTFDDSTINKLSKILDKNGKWKNLADSLKLDFISHVWDKAPSPTFVLLQYLNNNKARGEINVVLKALVDLQENDAVRIIKEMVSR